MDSTIKTISPTTNTMVQNIALRDRGGPSRNTFSPNGTNAMQSPKVRNGDSNLVPLRVPKGRKNIETNATERKILFTCLQKNYN